MEDFLARNNPWWFDASKIEEDPRVRAFKKSRFKWRPRLFDREELEESLYTLRGPRQVGKSTQLKLLIRDILASGAKPASVAYVPCDLISDYRELYSTLVRVSEALERPAIIILDEVTFVREWQRALKAFVDEGGLTGACVIACGSHSVDLRRGASLLAGRRGRARHPADRIMLPMAFGEFVKFLERDVGRLKVEEILHMRGAVREGVLSKLSDAFRFYLKSGGFPRVADEVAKKGRVSRETFYDFVMLISKDIARLGRSEDTARRLLGKIIEAKCTPISWNSLARDVGVSQPSIAEYVELLEGMFLIRSIHAPGRKLEPDRRKAKKVIFRDPFLFHVARAWTAGFPEAELEPWELVFDASHEPALAEMVVGEHLIRSFGSVMYWRAGDREVDFIVRLGGTVHGVEVKWRERVRRSEVRRALSAVGKVPAREKRLIILTKSELELSEGYALIPLPLFLLNPEFFLSGFWDANRELLSRFR